MKGRKASANMWWIIIGAVIALVVMIILMVMFTSKTQAVEGGLTDCEGKGGICISGENNPCPDNTLSSSAFSCTNSAKCCLGSPKEFVAGECNNVVSDLEGKRWCVDEITR